MNFDERVRQDALSWAGFINTWVGISISTFVLFVTLFTALPPKVQDFGHILDTSTSFIMASVILLVLSSYMSALLGSPLREFRRNHNQRTCIFTELSYWSLAIGCASYAIGIIVVLWGLGLRVAAFITLLLTIPAYAFLKFTRFGLMKRVGAHPASGSDLRNRLQAKV